MQDLLGNDAHVIEEGLCGRTTIHEDAYRDNRNGLKTLPLVWETYSPIDFVVLMLGTNDCKSFYSPNAYKIGKGLEQCVDKILEHISADRLLIISPIHLGDEVWKDEFDPEFDQASVQVSRELSGVYRAIANGRGAHFLAASDIAAPSPIDQEHLDEVGHRRLARAVYEVVGKA